MVLLIAFLCGLLSGFGVGGGNLLLLWLTGSGGLDAETARRTVLLFFLCTGAAAGFLHGRGGLIRWKTVICAVPVGCAAAFLLLRVSGAWSEGILQGLYTGFLLIAGIRELLQEPEEQSSGLQNR